ncbi:MAG: cell division protein FtsA [Verrucomicrobia bacterium]|nr:cell division protein FtsA [Verrucomicrobiota bacterium]
MFDARPQLVVGLEIGTSKVCAVVGERTTEGGLSIIGVGQARSRGVRKGEIVDTTAAGEDVRTAIAEAEQMADVEIRSVYLGVSGAHLQGFNNRGRHNIPSHDREIMDEDVQDVIKNAKAINLPGDRHVVHVIRQHFIVDGQEGVIDPLGMPGAHLEVDVHVVHGITNRLQTAIRVVKNLQLEVENLVFNGIASALAVLTPQEKQRGALVLDLGAGCTEYVVYADGVIRHTGTPRRRRRPRHQRPRLRPQGRHGPRRSPETRARLRPRHPRPPGPHGAGPRRTGPPRTFTQSRTPPPHHDRAPRGDLRDHRRAARSRGPARLPARRRGALWRGARVADIDRLAERVFSLPVALGRTKTISGLVATLDQPEFATGIGLVKFGSFQNAPLKGARWASRLKATLGNLTTALRRS